MYPSRWRKAIKKPSLARVFKTRAHVGYNLIKAVLLYSRVYLKFARLVWSANISSLWTDKRTLSRSIPRWFVRVVGRGKRDFPPRFDWKKTFDSKRGFYFSRGLPSPCRGNNAVFLGARSIQPRFPDEGFAHDLFPLPWLNSKGREGERKKRRTRSSYRYPDGTANFDESFSNGGAKPALSLSSVLGTLCARLLSARATGECYKSSSSFVRGGCRVDKCPFVNQKTLSFLSLSLFSLREASSNRTPDTFSFYLDLRELLFALGKNVARAMQPDTEYYFSYIIARNGIKVLLKFWGRRDLRGSIDFSMIFFLTKFDRIF